MGYLVSLVLLCIVYIAYRTGSVAYKLFQSVRVARRLPFPYFVVGWPDYNVFWRLMGNALLPYLGSWTRYIRPGLIWHEKGQIFEEIGSDVFLVVAPGDLRLWTRDPLVAQQITSNRIEWQKPVKGYKFLEIFGPNLITTEGDVWHRQKKVIAAAFAERCNELVWKETLLQVPVMVHRWADGTSQGVTSTHADFEEVARNVISYAGFGQQIGWDAERNSSISDASRITQSGSKYQYSSIEAINIIVLNLLRIYVTPKFLLRILPGKSQSICKAWKEFPLRMNDLIEARRNQVQCTKEAGKGSSGQLLDQMILAADTLNEDKGHSSNFGRTLTSEELVGNIFGFYVAGMESTAASSEVTVNLLAIYPQWQQQLHAKIDEYKETLGGKDVKDWTYDESTAFTYPLIFLYETLRLWPVVQGLPKKASATTCCIPYNGEMVPIPVGTRMVADVVAIHRHQGVWGQDSSEWNPGRWLTSDGKIRRPSKGEFLAFSEGARACIGKKFAETEFKGIMCCLFENYKVKMHIGSNKEDVLLTQEEAREQALKSMNFLKYRLALSLARRIPLDWTQRS